MQTAFAPLLLVPALVQNETALVLIGSALVQNETALVLMVSALLQIVIALVLIITARVQNELSGGKNGFALALLQIFGSFVEAFVWFK